MTATMMVSSAFSPARKLGRAAACLAVGRVGASFYSAMLMPPPSSRAAASATGRRPSRPSWKRPEAWRRRGCGGRTGT